MARGLRLNLVLFCTKFYNFCWEKLCIQPQFNELGKIQYYNVNVVFPFSPTSIKSASPGE